MDDDWGRRYGRPVRLGKNPTRPKTRIEPGRGGREPKTPAAGLGVSPAGGGSCWSACPGQKRSGVFRGLATWAWA